MGRKLAPKAVPYLKADGTTSWRVRLRVNGRQTTETFASEVAANVFISRVIDPAIGPERAVEMRDREDTFSPGYVPTIAEALERHVEDLTGVDERTKVDYMAVARRSWLPMLGSLRVDEVGRSDIARWVNSADGTVSPKTIRNAHAVLSGLLNWAVAESLIPANVARGTRLPRSGSENAQDIRFLTYDEFDLLYNEMPEAYRPLVTWLFGTGMRWSEATAQQVRDVDLRAGQWVGNDWTSAPTASVVRSWKKGRRLGPPKSAASKRTIVISPEVVEAAEPLMAGRSGTSFIFRTRTDAAVTHSNFFNRVWKPAIIRANVCEAHRLDGCRCGTAKPFLCPHHTERDPDGHQVLPEPCGCAGTLPFRPRIHDARHTHASWLIAQRIRLEVVQERLGHEDYLTTRRIYGHLMPDARIEAGVAASLAFASTALGRRGAAGGMRALPGGAP